MSVPATPAEVFAVLADGWMYAGWVVGASHIRAVDEDWPQVGARIHHSVGVWPFTIEDSTSVLDMEHDRLLELDARAWPVGRVHVRIELSPGGGGRTRIRMVENVAGGPGRVIPKPLTDPALDARNRESLRRLVDIAIGRRTAVQPAQAQSR
jgi:Polyketide cyclase / dehydrase and lipid transport